MIHILGLDGCLGGTRGCLFIPSSLDLFIVNGRDHSLMKLLLLLALVCVLGGRWSCIVAEATESSGSDLDLLVRIAREYR